VDRLVLFGSYASGNWHDGSDIDVVVISDDFADKGYWQRIDVLTEAIYELFEPIEAVALTNEEWDSRASRIVSYAEAGQVV
jgi:predicted nucleotidyltransferase